MKNRIWKKILAAGTGLLAQAGILAGCTAQPVVAYGAQAGNGSVEVAHEAAWKEMEQFKAEVSVNAYGLETLVWESEPSNTERESIGSTAGDAVDLQNGFSDHVEEIISLEALEVESTSVPTSYELVVWLSEYFQPDATLVMPEGCLKEELPVNTADGRSSTITGFRWKINPGEAGKQLVIPVTLREEYRFPAQNRTVPVCQDILHVNDAWNEENGGGIYIVKKCGNEKEILCRSSSKTLEIPAADMDFNVEMNPREETHRAGERIYMDVDLINCGQVPVYGISLKAQVEEAEETEEMEAVPVWEKEPGLEISGDSAVLESLSAGEKRKVTFYLDPAVTKNGDLKLAVAAQTENPVLIEKSSSTQLVIHPLKASFSVKKTADCESASPGDTITYQISIHNTGEQTLHSVITTERFGLAGVTATFLEQEGVTLNRSKTQAKIPEIVPGGCVNLKAKVVLPKELEDQDLVNQIIVVTDETGEESAVRNQATVRVESQKTENVGDGTGKSGSDGSIGTSVTSVKTGDCSHKEVFQVLILLSFFLSALSARRMFFRRKD